MKPETAARTVSEVTGHVVTKLRGLPSVTVNCVASLVFSWLRQEQPNVITTLGAPTVFSIVEELSK